MGRKGGGRSNYSDQGFSQPQNSGQGWGSSYRQPTQQSQPAGKQSGWGSAYSANSSGGQNRFGALGSTNAQNRQPQQRASGSNNQRSNEVNWRKVVEEDLLGPLNIWPLSCYAHTASPPGPEWNDVEGDETSFEELRWNDLQALRSGQTGSVRQQAFQANAAQQKQLYQALAKAAKPPILGGPELALNAFGGGGLKPGRLEGRLGPSAGFGTPSQPQQPSAFGAGPPKGFGGSAFGTPAQPSSVFGGGQTASQQQPSPFGTPAQPSSVFGGGQAAGIQQPAAFGTPAQPSPVFGGGQAASQQQPSPFGTPANPSSVFGGGQAAGPQQPAAFGTPATPAQPTTVFGQAASQQQPSGFGSQSASGFGPAASGQAASFGQPSGVGSQTGSVFGGGASAQTIAFGGQSAAAFGKGAFGTNQALGTTTSFGGAGAFGKQPSHPSPFGGAAGNITFGANARPGTTFGKPAGSLGAHPGPFGSQIGSSAFGSAAASGMVSGAPAVGGAAPSPSPFGIPTVVPSSQAGLAGGTQAVDGTSLWAAQFFEQGKIPDDPPPLEVCG